MKYDAVVVGSGPNGLAAALAMAGAGRSVLVLEAKDSIGGSARTAELTLPGFRHDVCSAIHPMARVSPFFRSLDLGAHGLTWVDPPAPLAHPLDDGSAAIVERDVLTTARGLGADGKTWISVFGPMVRDADSLFESILRPIASIHGLPEHPLQLARFGLLGVRSAASFADRFLTPAARALFGGSAAHAIRPLDSSGTASFGLALTLAAHSAGWPVARGGSGAIVEAMAAHLRSLGGEIETGVEVRSLAGVPDSRVVLFDVSPRSLASIAAGHLPAGYLRKLEAYRHGPGVFKVDWALDGPIPWTSPGCSRAATVHVGGTLEEIAAHERAVARGAMTDRPFVLVAQQSLFDSTRAPAGRQTGWAYCHVPNGSDLDATTAIEQQIERFAPGFRDRILARHSMGPAQYERYNANLVGGDIAGGMNTLARMLMRPFARLDPYATPNPRIFLCSSSTPPGGGVHGMCGWGAARSALRSPLLAGARTR